MRIGQPHHLDGWIQAELFPATASTSFLGVGRVAPRPSLCPFCERERTPADDNHAAHCPVWAYLPNGNT